jgi:hypothetical protein
MKLSIAVFTRNHAEWLPRILPQFQRIADELVVIVNSSTNDNSEQVAREYTSNVFLVPHEVVPEKQAVRMVTPCTGDWILTMVDDETLSSRWEDRSYVDRLMRDRYATHYWVPRRWLVPPGNQFIANSRWYPDFQMRLFRNIPSLIDFPGTLHSSPQVAGEPRYLADAWLYHWDLTWRDRAAREEKITEYRLASSDPLPDYYLYEGQQFKTEAHDYDVVAERGAEFAEAKVGSAEEAYRVAVRPLDLPLQVAAGAEHPVTLAIINRSSRTLKPSSHRLRTEPIKLSYHWLPVGTPAEDRSHPTWENPRHELPSRVAPGETAYRILSVVAPQTPGEYSLQFDLVEEGVAWFSQFSPAEMHAVVVTDGTR